MSHHAYRRSVLRGIDRPLPKYVPFPLLQDAINEVENNIQAPWALNLLAALGAIAIPIQGLFDVRKPTGQMVPTSIMMLSIANSGERKSTVENVFFNSIREFQGKQKSVYEAELKTWNSKFKIWKEKNKIIVKKISKLAAENCDSEAEELRLIEHELERPVKPKQFKLLYEDTTPEALFSGLHENLPSAGLISSEGDVLLNGRALADLSKLNAIWSGDVISVDRKTTMSFELEGARLTTSVMIQEHAFNKYLRRCGENSRGSGLWARFLVCFPESTQGFRTIKNETLSWEHCTKFSARMDELLAENTALLVQPNRKRQVIEFCPEAGELWLDVYNEIESEIREGGRFEKAGDHASKLADNIARVAALIHVFEGCSGGISLPALQFAADFCLWCSDQFYRIFIPPEQSEVDADELYAWLLRYWDDGKDWIPKTFVRQRCPNKLRDKDRLNLALEVLWRRRQIGYFYQGKMRCISLHFNVG